MSEKWVGEKRVSDYLLRVMSDPEALQQWVVEDLWRQVGAEVAARGGGPWGVTSFSEEWSYDPKTCAQVIRLTCEISVVGEEDWKVEDE